MYFDVQKYPNELHLGPWTPPMVPSFDQSFLTHFQMDILDSLSISLKNGLWEVA